MSRTENQLAPPWTQRLCDAEARCCVPTQRRSTSAEKFRARSRFLRSRAFPPASRSAPINKRVRVASSASPRRARTARHPALKSIQRRPGAFTARARKRRGISSSRERSEGAKSRASSKFIFKERARPPLGRTALLSETLPADGLARLSPLSTVTRESSPFDHLCEPRRFRFGLLRVFVDGSISRSCGDSPSVRELSVRDSVGAKPCVSAHSLGFDEPSAATLRA